MDKKHKLSYNPPKVTSVSFMVEMGLYASQRIEADMMLMESFGSASWDEPSSSTATGHFGDGDWTGGSSFSNNNNFGSGSWDN
jgi:hypothetical protein